MQLIYHRIKNENMYGAVNATKTWLLMFGSN